MNLNKLLLAGNMTRDPELRYTPKGTAIAQTGIAVNRRWKGEDGEEKEEVTFVDVTFWGRTAETVGQYFKKGSPIFIEGRLKLDSWEDKQTKQRRQKLSVVAENFQFVGPKQEGGERPAARPAPAPATGGESDGPPEGDDVPF